MMVSGTAAYFAFPVFFKPMLDDFGWTRAMTSGAFSLSWIAQTLVAIPMGRLVDKFGPRFTMTICGCLMGLGYLLISQVNSIWQLYLYYGVMIGSSVSGQFLSLTSTVARWFIKRRGLTMGMVLAGGSLGTFIVPPLANQLISIYDWRVAYFILGVIVLVVDVLLAQLLRRDPHQMGLPAYGEKEREQPLLKLHSNGFTLGEATLTRQFWLVFVLVFAVGYCYSAIIVHVVAHSTDIGIPASTAATILATIGGMNTAGRIIGGSTADRIGNKRAYITALVLVLAALLYLVQASDLYMLYLFAAVFGFAIGPCIALQSPFVAGLFGLKSHGQVLAGITVGYTLGAALGPFVTGYIFDTQGSYQVAFLLSVAICVIALTCISILKPTNIR